MAQRRLHKRGSHHETPKSCPGLVATFDDTSVGGTATGMLGYGCKYPALPWPGLEAHQAAHISSLAHPVKNLLCQGKPG